MLDNIIVIASSIRSRHFSYLVCVRACACNPVFFWSPRFNYRATHYMAVNGYYNFHNWFDDRAWYPLGRIVGGTVGGAVVCLRNTYCSILKLIISKKQLFTHSMLILKSKLCYNYCDMLVIMCGHYVWSCRPSLFQGEQNNCFQTIVVEEGSFDNHRNVSMYY